MADGLLFANGTPLRTNGLNLHRLPRQNQKKAHLIPPFHLKAQVVLQYIRPAQMTHHWKPAKVAVLQEQPQCVMMVALAIPQTGAAHARIMGALQLGAIEP